MTGDAPHHKTKQHLITVFVKLRMDNVSHEKAHQQSDYYIP